MESVDWGVGGWVEWVCVDLDAVLWVGEGVGLADRKGRGLDLC
jgi:hypothetical protein